jgi:hypothetical protein
MPVTEVSALAAIRSNPVVRPGLKPSRWAERARTHEAVDARVRRARAAVVRRAALTQSSHDGVPEMSRNSFVPHALARLLLRGEREEQCIPFKTSSSRMDVNASS